MSHQIIIIGGGLSGLCVLHQLKQKFKESSNVQVLLLEKNSEVGGTIRSESRNGCLFEAGPEGFLNSKESTLQLIDQIGLGKDLIAAQPAAKLRYLSINDKLYSLPMNPLQLFSFKPLDLFAKLRIFGEIFIPKGGRENETVYEFGCRRFGKKFTEYFFDAMVHGIYGGNVKEMNLKTSFPIVYTLEEKYGSVIRGFIRERKAKKSSKGTAAKKSSFGQLSSLRQGMSQISRAIYEKYREYIHTNEEVHALTPYNNGYIVETSRLKYFADHIFLCAPAYSAAKLLKPLSEPLFEKLSRIEYAPITVVGLVYKIHSLPKIPQGFGYLVPSGENKKILGVLFSSNVFTGRCAPDQFIFRVMIKGLTLNDDNAIKIAREEIAQMFSVVEPPAQTFLAKWPKAIPQYTTRYQEILDTLQKELIALKNLYIVANYIGGVGVNDCTQNAKTAVENLKI